MKIFSVTLTFIMVLMLSACNETVETNTSNTTLPPRLEQDVNANQAPKSMFVKQLETAHAVDKFYKNEAIAFDINLTWGGEPRLKGRITSMTNSTKVKMEKADGSTIIYDGNDVYFSPDTADAGGARFAIFTWQYFVMAPFKYSDPGTNWEDMGKMKVSNDQVCEAAKLTFNSGVGDAPDDWYIAFRNPETNLTDGMAYIVTGGKKSQEEAEKRISAVTYHDYEVVNGVPIPMNMKFWYFDMEKGLQNQKGAATVSNIEFLTEEKANFEVPKNSKPVSL